MNTVLIPERLIKSRKLLGLNKAEAARLLNLSKMGYDRYESGERSPSCEAHMDKSTCFHMRLTPQGRFRRPD